MTTRTHVLTLYDCPKSVNAGGGGARRHWGAAHKEKRMWEDRFLNELWVARVRKGMDFCDIAVLIRFKNRVPYKGGRDVENYRHPVVKPLQDALVKGGYLHDDTSEWVEVSSFRLEEGVAEWPHCDPRRKVELVVALAAMYL